MDKYLIFDIGGTSTKYAIFNKEGEKFESGKIPRQDNFTDLLDNMINVYEEFNYVTNIAISSPGAVNREAGIVGGASALDYIHGPNFKSLFKERTGLNIEIENDANCAALSEIYYGYDNEINDACYVVFGSGIGGSLIKDKKIHSGSNLHGGEFGYVIINNKLETWSEVGAPVNFENYVKVKYNDPKLEGEYLFDNVNIYPGLKEDVDNFYLINAIELYNLQYIYDPQVIYLGGALTNNVDVINNIIDEVSVIHDKHLGKIKPNIKIGKNKSDANLLGALSLLVFK